MKARRRLAVALLSLAFAACGGEAPKKAGPPQVTGFASLPWGTSSDSAVKALGRPQRTDTVYPGTVALTWPRKIQDDSAGMSLIFHGGDGLVQGNYGFTVWSPEKCRRVMEMVRRSIATRYPALEPRPFRDGDGRAQPCEPSPDRSSSVHTRWEDPANGASIVLFSRDTVDVQVIYMSKRGHDLTAQDSAREARKDF